MGLSAKDTNRPGAKYFVNQGVIKDFKVEYGKELSGRTIDVSLEVKVDVSKSNGETYEKTLYIDGSYKKSSNGVLEGWGSAFAIKEFFQEIGLRDWETDESGHLPDTLFKDALGRTVYFLVYISQKPDGDTTYRQYKRVGSDAVKVETKFSKDCAGEYPPYKYMPELIDDSTIYDFPPADTANVMV